MAISAKQLDKLFNSSGNSVDDDELKALHDKAGGGTEDDYDGGDEDMEEMLSTGSGFSGKAKSKKRKEKEKSVDNGSLEDFDLVVEGEDDEDISEIVKKMDKEKEEKPVGHRVPFEVDFEDDDDDGSVVSADKGVSSESDVSEELAVTKRERQEMDELEHGADGSGPESLPDSEEEELDEEENLEHEEDQAVREQLMKVCRHEEYLEDPKYLLFYREKLRAVNFLERSVPTINFKKLEKELQMMYVKVDEDKILSLDEFNQKIQQIQALRNRLTKIRSLSIRDYVLRKRVVKLLEDCLNRQSTEKSNDRRVGEIQIHMSDMEYHLAMSEAFYRDVEQIADNIACAHEALSRQITCIQERNKEISRGGEPYVESRSEDRWDIVTHKEKKHGYKKWNEIV